jgi:hypothetical protein
VTKTDKLNELFDRWERERPEYQGIFVRDGIINEIEYDKAPHKILFIAKEANHDDAPTAGDFRDWWNNRGLHGHFCLHIAEWSFGILNEFPPFEDVHWDHKQDWESRYRSSLQSIAFMDVKKSGGGSRSNHHTVYNSIINNLDFLHEQIEIINPNIIINCLVDITLTNALFDVKNEQWKKSGYIRSLFNWRGVRVIDFYHPSGRTVPAASYSLLQNIVRSKAFQQL